MQELYLSRDPERRREELQSLRDRVAATKPEDCGHKHEIRVAQYAAQNRSVLEAFCPRDVQLLNPKCAHRSSDFYPNPYLTELSYAWNMDVFPTFEEYDRLWKICMGLKTEIHELDYKAGEKAQEAQENHTRFPLEVIQEKQSPSTEILLHVRQELLDALDKKLQELDAAGPDTLAA